VSEWVYEFKKHHVQRSMLNAQRSIFESVVPREPMVIRMRDFFSFVIGR
jgi:hypothetical protein